MDELTEIQQTQKRINTICGLVESLKKLYIKVGVLYTVGTVGSYTHEHGGSAETIHIVIDDETLEYPPLFLSYAACEQYIATIEDNEDLRVVEMHLTKIQ